MASHSRDALYDPTKLNTGRYHPTVRSRRSVAIVAIAGVVIAHAVDYLVVYRGDAAREHQLAETGHGYWPLAVALALVATLVAAASAAGRGGMLGLARPTAESERLPMLRDIARLSLLQVLLFSAVEVLERLAVGLAPPTVLQTPEFAVGIGLQVVVAVVALDLVERLSETVVRAAVAARALRPRRAAQRSPEVQLPAGAAVVCTIRARAPPLAFLA
jgi:hypothetical protein